MEASLAREILTEAKAMGNLIDGPIPEADEACIKQAQELVDMARAAARLGTKDTKVMTVLRMADSGPIEEGHPEIDPEPEPQAEPADEPEADPAERPATIMEQVTEDKISEVRKVSKREAMPVPEEISGEDPQMPYDITKISDDKLRDLHGKFAAWQARATWLAGQANNDIGALKQIITLKKNQAMKVVGVHDDKGKEKKLAVLEVEVLDQDPTIRDDMGKLQQATEVYNDYKTLKEIYTANCDRLSREWSMRNDGKRS